MKKIKFETSWDDWGKLNYKLAELLKKYNIVGTFYFEAGDFNVEDYKKIVDMGFKIGSHTLTHPNDIKLLSYGEQEDEVKLSKLLLETALNINIDSFCYPRGRYDLNTIKLVKEAGYKNARTTKVLQTSYEDEYQKPTTIHFFDRKEYQGRDLLEISKEYFDKALVEGSYFHLFGHAWEIEKNGLWDKLEQFLIYVKNSNTV
jgi:peptidoglycan/xylan/chitin deacetylase (PgdA/CDA1 family)